MNLHTLTTSSNFQNLINIIQKYETQFDIVYEDKPPDSGVSVLRKISNTCFDEIATELKINKNVLEFIFVIEKFGNTRLNSNSSYYALLVVENDFFIICGNDFLSNNTDKIIYKSYEPTKLITTGRAISIGFNKSIDNLDKCIQLFS